MRKVMMLVLVVCVGAQAEYLGVKITAIEGDPQMRVSIGLYEDEALKDPVSADNVPDIVSVRLHHYSVMCLEPSYWDAMLDITKMLKLKSNTDVAVYKAYAVNYEVMGKFRIWVTINGTEHYMVEEALHVKKGSTSKMVQEIDL